MSRQPLDLRKSILIIKRFRVTVGIVAALGLFAGAGYAAINPPESSSSAVVSFPTSVKSTATQVVIAGSYPVLSAASTKIKPPVTVDKLRSEVQVNSLTTYLISIKATAKTPGDAEEIANTVAQSYISYVADKKSPVMHVVAQLFQPAVTASTPSRVGAVLTTGLIGLLAGVVVGSVAVLAIGREDKRLRERDQIANSIGVPVIASVPVGHPSDPAGWTKLVENYKPQAVHAWQLRTVLRYLGISEQKFGQSPNGENGENGHAPPDGGGDGVSLGVISLSSDPGALALGPQLAVFAASQGIPTALVIGPQQDEGATAALRTACAAPQSSPELPSTLRLIVSDGQDADEGNGVALTVVVVTVDGRAPKIPATVRTAVTVIGVSAGRAVAEQLARIAVAAGGDRREVTGILVADPEEEDKTTGRVPHLIRPPQRRLPNRLKGVVTESRR